MASKQITEKKATFEKTARWGQDRRLEFIEFRLMWEGQINRSDLTDFFRISIPQASLDLARYIAIAPGNMEYDRRDKMYRATITFKPRLSEYVSSRYLNPLLAVNTGMMPREMSFIGWYPESDAVLSPGRSVPPAFLARTLTAIRARKSLLISYQSMTRDEPSERRISPHAVAYDGGRWHARAYCHSREKFIDFVFARILTMGDEELSNIDQSLDTEWHAFVEVRVIPHRGLTEGQKRAISLDFGMEDGQLRIPCRQALLFYLIQRLGLLFRASDIEPRALQLEVANKSEIEDLLGRKISDGLDISID
jgi:hypothetical protein